MVCGYMFFGSSADQNYWVSGLRPLSKILKTAFRKPHLFPSSALSKGPNRVGVSLPSPEDGKKFSFRKVVIVVVYLEFQTIDKVLKQRDSEY
jgi:hypothetical protein